MGRKRKEYTAQERAMPRLVKPHGRSKGKNLTSKEFLAERYYRICLQIVGALLADGLLTKKEAVGARKKLKVIYKPIVGKLTDDERWEEVRK